MRAVLSAGITHEQADHIAEIRHSQPSSLLRVIGVDIPDNAELAGVRLRRRLADAGILSSSEPLDTDRPDPAEVAAARKRAGRGRPLSDYLASDR